MDAENKTTGEVKSEVINEPKTVIVGGNAALGKATTDDGSIGRAANMESPQPILEEISEFQIGTDVVSSNVLSMVPTLNKILLQYVL
jgi:hypothetical protein